MVGAFSTLQEARDNVVGPYHLAIDFGRSISGATRTIVVTIFKRFGSYPLYGVLRNVSVIGVFGFRGGESSVSTCSTTGAVRQAIFNVCVGEKDFFTIRQAGASRVSSPSFRVSVAQGGVHSVISRFWVLRRAFERDRGAPPLTCLLTFCRVFLGVPLGV